jgi:hypothetical protein
MVNPKEVSPPGSDGSGVKPPPTTDPKRDLLGPGGEYNQTVATIGNVINFISTAYTVATATDAATSFGQTENRVVRLIDEIRTSLSPSSNIPVIEQQKPAILFVLGAILSCVATKKIVPREQLEDVVNVMSKLPASQLKLRLTGLVLLIKKLNSSSRSMGDLLGSGLGGGLTGAATVLLIKFLQNNRDDEVLGGTSNDQEGQYYYYGYGSERAWA